jgi:hypothetical protein
MPAGAAELDRLTPMTPPRRLLGLGLGVLLVAGCPRASSRRLDPVRAIRAQVRPGFQPPADGLITQAQIDRYLAARRAAKTAPESVPAARPGPDPAELAWVRARIVEALAALDSRDVTAAAAEGYSRAIVNVREARRAARDPQAAARLDAEIAALERERATLRRAEGVTPRMLENAARVAPHRAEIESSGP